MCAEAVVANVVLHSAGGRRSNEGKEKRKGGEKPGAKKEEGLTMAMPNLGDTLSTHLEREESNVSYRAFCLKWGD